LRPGGAPRRSGRTACCRSRGPGTWGGPRRTCAAAAARVSSQEVPGGRRGTRGAVQRRRAAETSAAAPHARSGGPSRAGGAARGRRARSRGAPRRSYPSCTNCPPIRLPQRVARPRKAAARRCARRSEAPRTRRACARRPARPPGAGIGRASPRTLKSESRFFRGHAPRGAGRHLLSRRLLRHGDGLGVHLRQRARGQASDVGE
jgi:hypothetical protein